MYGASAEYVDIPPRVFECRLACLQPSELHSARYGWEAAMSEFKKLTNGKVISAEVRITTRTQNAVTVSTKLYFRFTQLRMVWQVYSLKCRVAQCSKF